MPETGKILVFVNVGEGDVAEKVSGLESENLQLNNKVALLEGKNAELENGLLLVKSENAQLEASLALLEKKVK